MNVMGDMGFAMYYGACNTFVSNNAEFVLLCFTFVGYSQSQSQGDNKECYR